MPRYRLPLEFQTQTAGLAEFRRLTQAMEKTEAMAQDPRLPELHRAQLKANLKFFRDFQLQPNRIFEKCIESFDAVLKHNHGRVLSSMKSSLRVRPMR